MVMIYLIFISLITTRTNYIPLGCSKTGRESEGGNRGREKEREGERRERARGREKEEGEREKKER